MKGMKVFLVVFAIILATSLASSQTASKCNLNASLVNQDPFPAVPGDYVDLVFQVTGVNEPSCGTLKFQLQEEYPLIFDPGFTGFFTAQSGVFAQDFKSFWLIPVKVRIDSNALDGKNQIEAVLTTSTGSQVFKFNVDVKDIRTDFEISIKDYEASTQTLTFEILNTGDNDVEALTIEIPKQDNIEVKGSKRNIVGSLDANEDSTFSFEAVPKDGEISLTILYNDATGERRTQQETVVYDSSYFTGRATDQKSLSVSFYILVLLILVLVGRWGYKRWKKSKAKQKHSHLHHHS